MKLFKRIYFPVLGVLLVAVLVLGFVDARTARPGKTVAASVSASMTHVENIAAAERTADSSEGTTLAREYVYDALSAVLNPVDASVDEDGYTQVGARGMDGVGDPVPTVTLQETTLLDSTLRKFDIYDGSAVVGKTVRNIVAYIPGRVTLDGGQGDAVLMTAHLDAYRSGLSASEAVPAAVMLQNILDIREKELTYKNDLVFVFTDASSEGALGAAAFMGQFKGFDGVVERIKLSADFAAFGNKGTLGLYDVSKENTALIGAYAGINGSGYMSSLFPMFGLKEGVRETDTFGGAYVGIGNYGTADNNADTPATLSKNMLKQYVGVMTRFTEKFGGYDLSKLDAKTATTFFTYLSLFTVWYPAFVSYILAAIIIGLLVAIIIISRKKNAFSLGRAFGGAVVQLLSIAATVLTLFATYYLMGLLLVGFGAFNIHAINNLVFGNIGLLIGAMLLATAIHAAFTLVFKKIFMIKATDAVRGNAVLWAAVGIVFGFALPTYGYIFTIGAILELVVMLLVTIFKDKYKANFSQDIERLMLYNVPLIFILPMLIPALTVAASSLKAVFLPLLMIAFLLAVGFITPYLNFLEPVLDKVFKKLPERKYRVEETYEEEILDPAKPGKKGQIVTKKRTVTKSTPWNYRSWMTVATAVVVSCLVVIFSTVFTHKFTSTVASRFSGYDVAYDNALVYVWDNTAGTVRQTIEVRDLDAYRDISRVVDGLTWDASKKAYVKNDTSGGLVTSSPTIVRDDKVYTVTPYDANNSRVRLVIKNTGNVDKLTFAPVGSTDDGEKFEVDPNGVDTLTVDIPFGYGAFTMTVEGTADTLDIDYRENCTATQNMNRIDDWATLSTGSYKGSEKVTPYVRAGLVLYSHFSA